MRYVHPDERVSFWSLCAMAAAWVLQVLPRQTISCKAVSVRNDSDLSMKPTVTWRLVTGEERVITLRSILDDGHLSAHYRHAPVRPLRASDHHKVHYCLLEETNVARGLWMANGKCPSCAWLWDRLDNVVHSGRKTLDIWGELWSRYHPWVLSKVFWSVRNVCSRTSDQVLSA